MAREAGGRAARPRAGELMAAFAGYLAAGAGIAEPPTVPPPGVRRRVALPWVVQWLGLPTPSAAEKFPRVRASSQSAVRWSPR